MSWRRAARRDLGPVLDFLLRDEALSVPFTSRLRAGTRGCDVYFDADGNGAVAESFLYTSGGLLLPALSSRDTCREGLQDILRDLRKRCNVRSDQVIGIGMGVPGPVEFGSGLLVAPPIMPGWEGFSIREYLREEYHAPAFIDNDVNAMAMGELWRLHRELPNFIVVKVGTGIGCGIVCNGMIYRGTNGSAGDVGHICVDPNGERCHCGNQGCVEIMAAGPAIARMGTEAAKTGKSPQLAQILASKGVITPEDVGQAGSGGDVASNAIIKLSGKLIGQMLASAVNFFNPSHVFIGGGVSHIGPLFLAAIRQSVYQRSLALSTRHLEILYAPLGDRAGVFGCAAMALHETMRVRGVLA